MAYIIEENFKNYDYEWEDILSKLRTEASTVLIKNGYKYSEEIDGETFIVQDYILINENGEEKKIKIKNTAPKIIFK